MYTFIEIFPRMDFTKRNILIFIGIIILVFIFWFFKTIVIYLIIAGILSLIGKSFIRLLNKNKWIRQHIPIVLKAFLTLLIFYGILAILFTSFAPIINNQIDKFSSINPATIQENLQEPLSYLSSKLEHYGITDFQGKTSHYLSTKSSNIIDFKYITETASGIISGIGSIVIAFFAITFITFFFLKEETLFYDIILFFVPDKYDDRFLTSLKKIERLLSGYFLGLIIESTTLGSMITLGLYFILGLSFSNSLLIGIFAGLINVIPYVGPAIGMTFAVTYTLLEKISDTPFYKILPTLGFVLLIYAIAQMIDAFLLQPTIFAKSVKAHPLEIFIVIMMAGSIGGILGMIIGIPSYTILRVLAAEFLGKYKVVREITDKIN